MTESHDLNTPRMEIHKIVPDYYRAMAAVESVPKHIEQSLHELIKIRVSQINGCGFCLDAHSREAMAGGETVQRIVLLDAWRESPQFSERERAALALAEAVTLISVDQVPDDVYNEAAECFEPQELGELIWRIAMINVWNRIAITTRMVPGSYKLRVAAPASVPAG